MDWDLEKLSAIIAQNEEAIHKTTENEIIENANYKRLCALLVSARQQYKESVRFKVVTILEDDLLKLSENVEVDKLFVEEYLDQTSFMIDADINILDTPIPQIPRANEDARTQLTSLSKSGLVVLEICPDGRINSFVRGEVFPQTIFYSAEEYSRFSYELRPMDDIEDILEEYRRAVNERYWNSKFFIPKASLNSLRVAMNSKDEEEQFRKSHIQLLVNAPEDSFRQDLLVFLRNRLDAIVQKETSLDNGRRMDIYVISKIESNLVFLEVKWLGRAIKPSGDGIGTVMTQADIVPNAFNQVVDYIRQLTTQRHDVRKGYLVVFDARDGNLPDSGDGMKDEMWSDENKPYMYKFRKIQDFKVVNSYPR